MSNYLMIPSKTVKSDLLTSNKYLVYIPIATRDTYGSVKLGDGIKVEDGKITIDTTKLPIREISKNGVNITPDENGKINIVLTKDDVGLHNVDNTADINKIVSGPQQSALNKKVDKYQGIENVGKVLSVGSDGNVSLSASVGGTIITKNNGVLISDTGNIYNFSDDFVITSNGTEINIKGSEALKSSFKNVTYDGKTGVLTFVRYDDTTLTVDLPLELITKSGYYDPIVRELVLVLTNDDEIRIPVGDLIDQYYADENTLTLKKIGDKLTFSIKEGVLEDYVPVKGTQILDAKVFNDEIAILNTNNNTIDRIKHINNNFLISGSDGVSLLNIDTQLQTVSAFNKQLAFKDDVVGGSIDPATNISLGSFQGNYNADVFSSPTQDSPEIMSNVTHGVLMSQYHLVDNGVGLIYLSVPEIYSYFKTSLGEIDSILDLINGEVI